MCVEGLGMRARFKQLLTHYLKVHYQLGLGFASRNCSEGEVRRGRGGPGPGPDSQAIHCL